MGACHNSFFCPNAQKWRTKSQSWFRFGQNLARHSSGWVIIVFYNDGNVGCLHQCSDSSADMLTDMRHVGKYLANMLSKYVNHTILLTCQQDIIQHIANMLTNSFGRKENIPKFYKNHTVLVYFAARNHEKGITCIDSPIITLVFLKRINVIVIRVRAHWVVDMSRQSCTDMSANK